MPNYDSDLLDKICLRICDSIIAIQKDHPELLITKYQTIEWYKKKSTIAAKFRGKFSQAQTSDELLQKLNSLLREILVPAAFDLSAISDLISSFKQINLENSELNTTHSLKQPEQEYTGITVLLLDAENLQLNTNTEKILTKTCNSPLQVKIAFANWSNLGKLDAELHQRGYDLIHVPAGRDNADGKMIAVGSSIHERYPNVKEVFVCSSDKVMTNLCNILQQKGILVYQVGQQGENIKLFNSSSGTTVNYCLKPLPEIPSVEQFISQIKTLIKLHQKENASYLIKLSVLCQLFKSKYQLTISQIVSHHFPSKKVRDFFINYTSEFVVHQIDENSELYITVFEHHQIKPESSSGSSQTQPILFKINSAADLEKAIKNILNNLTQTDKQKSLDVILGSKFFQRYGVSVTEQIKKLKIDGNFIKFLRSCNSLKIQQVGDKWEVAIREQVDSQKSDLSS